LATSVRQRRQDQEVEEGKEAGDTEKGGMGMVMERGPKERRQSMRGFQGLRPAFFSHLSCCECCVLLRLEIELVNAAAGNAWLVIETRGGEGGRVSAGGVRGIGTAGRVLGSRFPEIIIKMSGFDDSPRRCRRFINKVMH